MNNKAEFWAIFGCFLIMLGFVVPLHFRMATREDIKHLRSELKADIKHLRSELKADVKNLRSELKADVKNLRSELKADIRELRTLLTTHITHGGHITHTRQKPQAYKYKPAKSQKTAKHTK